MSTVSVQRWPVQNPDRLELPRLTCLLVERDYSPAYIDAIVNHAVLERSVKSLVGLLEVEDLDDAKEQLRADLAARAEVVSRLAGIAIHELTLYPPELEDDLGADIPFLGDKLISEC